MIMVKGYLGPHRYIRRCTINLNYDKTKVILEVWTDRLTEDGDSIYIPAVKYFHFNTFIEAAEYYIKEANSYFEDVL